MAEKRSIPNGQGEHTSSPEETLAEQDVAQDHSEPTLQTEGSDHDESTSLSGRPDAKETCPESNKPNSLSSQEKVEATTSNFESPKPSSPFVLHSDSSVEGAVGGGNLELENSSSTDSAIREQNKHASVLYRSLFFNPGKLDIFKRFFKQDDLQSLTRPEYRQRHRAGRLGHYFEGCRPESEERSSEENPLRYMQSIDSLLEPLLNSSEAGAVVGVKSRVTFLRWSDENNSLSGFGYIADTEHSLGSAKTVPVEEVYPGNVSPFISPSEVSSRGVSPGSSFPSFPSRPQTSSDCYNPKISPSPSLKSPDDTKIASPVSTDSESFQKEKRSVRRRKPVLSRQVNVPQRCESALAGSEGSYSGEQKSKTHGTISTRFVKSRSKRERKGTRDSSPDSTQSDLDEYLTQKAVTDSEDDGVIYPELSHSLGSDHSLPVPDIGERISELEQGLSDLGVSDDARPQTEESDRDDPLSVLSCSSEASRNLVLQSPKNGKNK